MIGRGGKRRRLGRPDGGNVATEVAGALPWALGGRVYGAGASEGEDDVGEGVTAELLGRTGSRGGGGRWAARAVGR